MTILDDILASTRARIEQLAAADPSAAFEQRIAGLGAPRPFERALRAPGTRVIAEIKRRSPSKGDLAPGVDAGAAALAFAQGGAAALSVLTEPDHFAGSLEDMQAAAAAGLPVLRKDFLLDELQVLESRAAGADAVLLIARVAGGSLGRLHAAARALGLDVLVEVFDEADVEAALAAGATLVGINHRDLQSFEVDMERTAKLAPLIPGEVCVVALSGVETRADIDVLAAAGVHAVLVGESLVTAPDPAAAVRSLVGG